MITLDIDDIMPGLTIGSDIYRLTNTNIPLLTEGHVLTESEIKAMKAYGIKEVNIIVKDSENTFPDEFCNYLKNVIESAYQSNSINILKKYAKLYAKICEGRQFFKINMEKYVAGDTPSTNPHFSADEHIVNVVNMAVAIATIYNQTEYKKDIIPIEQVALAAMLMEVGRYANVKSELDKLKTEFKSSDIIKRIETSVYTNNRIYNERNKNTTGTRAIYTKIPEFLFDEYDKMFIPLYSYLLTKKYNLDAVVHRAILYSGENYDNFNGTLGIALNVYNQDDKISSKISEILRITSLYDLHLYHSYKNCVEQGIPVVFSDVMQAMNHYANTGVISPKMLRYLSEVIPVYQVGQTVTLNDGSVGIVADNSSFDKTHPTIIDYEGRVINEKGIHIVAPYIDSEPVENIHHKIG